MISTTRVIVILGVLFALAACSHDGALPPMQQSVLGGSLTNSLTRTRMSSQNPCAIPNAWTFGGPCTLLRKLAAAGATVRFPAYHGLTVTVKIPPSGADGQSFVTGYGTSDKDVTGTFGTVFPEFGANGTGCIAYDGTSQCKGKGVLYLLEYVPSTDTHAIGFQKTPHVQIVTNRAFPGTKCAAASLSSSGKWYWIDQGTAKPQGTTVTFKEFPLILTLSEGSFMVFAFHCW